MGYLARRADAGSQRLECPITSLSTAIPATSAKRSSTWSPALLGPVEAQGRGIFRRRRNESRDTRQPFCQQESTLRFLLVHHPFTWSVRVQMANPGKRLFQAVFGAFPDPLVGFHDARGLVIPGDGLLAVGGPVLDVAQIDIDVTE